MPPRFRLSLIPAVEVLVTVALTAGAFFLAVHYNVASLLDALSTRAHLGFDSADLGPGFFVLSCGLGLMTLRRWKEATHEPRTLAHTRDILQESEDRYRSLVEMSPAPMVVSDPRGRIVFVNDAALHLLRLDAPDAAIGGSIVEFVKPDSRARATDLYARTLAGEPVPTEEIRLCRHDGTEVAVQMGSSADHHR